MPGVTAPKSANHTMKLEPTEGCLGFNDKIILLLLGIDRLRDFATAGTVQRPKSAQAAPLDILEKPSLFDK